MHTWRLIDIAVFLTFFFTPFCSASFFLSFGDLAKKIFAELPHCVNHSVHTVVVFFWTLCGFFYKSLMGASVTLHS